MTCAPNSRSSLYAIELHGKLSKLSELLTNMHKGIKVFLRKTRRRDIRILRSLDYH